MGFLDVRHFTILHLLIDHGSVKQSVSTKIVGAFKNQLDGNLSAFIVTRVRRTWQHAEKFLLCL